MRGLMGHARTRARARMHTKCALTTQIHTQTHTHSHTRTHWGPRIMHTHGPPPGPSLERVARTPTRRVGTEERAESTLPQKHAACCIVAACCMLYCIRCMLQRVGPEKRAEGSLHSTQYEHRPVRLPGLRCASSVAQHRWLVPLWRRSEPRPVRRLFRLSVPFSTIIRTL